MDIHNKTILITGASDGIGRHLALKLAEKDTKLVLCGRDIDKLRDLQINISKFPNSSSKTYAFDLNDDLAMEEAVEKIITENEELDILINNAGVWQKTGPLTLISDEDIENIINTNLTSQIKLTKKILPVLKHQEQALVVNIISRSATFAPPGQSVYAASKWGMRGFTEVLREDLKDSSVKVMGVYQGGVNTYFHQKTGDKLQKNKYTEPQDLAELIVYSISRPAKLWVNELLVNYK